MSDSLNVRKSQIIWQHLNGAAVGAPSSEDMPVAGIYVGQSYQASPLPPYRFDADEENTHGSKGSSKKKRKQQEEP